MKIEQTVAPIFAIKFDVDTLTPHMNESLPVTLPVEVHNMSEFIPVTISHDDYESPAQAYIADERDNKETEQFERAYAAHVIGLSLLSKVSETIEGRLKLLSSSDNKNPLVRTEIYCANSYNFAAFGVQGIGSEGYHRITNPLDGNVKRALGTVFGEAQSFKFYDPDNTDMDFDLEADEAFVVINDCFVSEYGLTQNVLIAKLID